MNKTAVKKRRIPRAWTITTIILVILLVLVNVLGLNIYYTTLTTVLGGGKAIYEDGTEAKYVSSFSSKEEALQNANDINEEICEEGTVLLKNEDSALPLEKGSKISIFGKNSINLVYSGSGSAEGDSSSAKTIYESLEEAGFSCNPTLKEFYEDTSKSGSPREQNSSDMDSGNEVSISTGETAYENYTKNNIPDSYEEYSDAAVVVFSRIGGEGFDLPKTSEDDENRHYLELDPNEQELLTQVTSAGFKKVIVVINSANAMELGFVEDGTYGDVDACLMIGRPGNSGIMALGKILSGEVNPSGHTADTYVADMTQEPSWNNFGYADNSYDEKGDNGAYYFAEYEEGIYVGYRYWETRGYTEAQEDGNEEWYNEHVVYPFGYGLSYTSFDWEIEDASAIEDKEITADGSYEVKVKVTNTGNVAGKDVVELYCNTPYYKGEIEKAHKVLCGYEKTPELQPGESCTVTLTFTPYDVASYDFNDANKNDFTGYELDGGDYHLFVSTDAHTEKFDIPFTVAKDGIQYENDPETGNKVENRFEEAADYLTTTLSRADWEGTFPTKATAEDKKGSTDMVEKLGSKDVDNEKIASGEYDTMPETGKEVTVKLQDVAGLDYDDPKWDELLDELTVDEMAELYNNGAFKSVAILKIGKPETIDADGPGGFSNFMEKTDPKIFDTCMYASEVVLASTWNRDLAKAMGEAVGEEALQGNTKDGTPYSGWYAPGVNIHRSPFGGRNGEYFSEDTYLSGQMAANEIQGASEKGVYTFMKHFAVNEQETKRSINGLVNWLDEQTLREIYLKPFETAVKEGKATGIMSSFTRIGYTWAGGNYDLLTGVLRDEWGFRGTVITDFNTNSYMGCKQEAYAGGDLNLSTTRDWHSYEADNANDVNVLRNAAHNILYTVANSNALNGTVIGYTTPTWVIITYVAEALLILLDLVWGFFAFHKLKKKNAEA